MITAGSVPRDLAVERFAFLAQRFCGRRNAIKDFTHTAPEFVFWIYPDGTLFDAKDAYRKNVPRGYRLGLIAVLAEHRRRQVAKALGSVHGRGHSHVSAEADTGNIASNALITGIGGTRIGGSVELFRPVPPNSDIE
jgi:hypothetical protein